MQEPKQRKRGIHYASTKTAGQLEAYFEMSVDDVGTDKGLTCPLYIQELDCAVLYRQTLTPCIVFCISLVTNEGISIQALYDLVFWCLSKFLQQHSEHTEDGQPRIHLCLDRERYNNPTVWK